MKRQTVLRWIGAAILVAIMVGEAFSLGVYVGVKRPPKDATSQVLAAQWLPPAAIADASGPVAVVGIIEAVSDASLTLLAGNQLYTATLEPDARVLRDDGRLGSPADLTPGRRVVVVGWPGQDGRDIRSWLVAPMPGQP